MKLPWEVTFRTASLPAQVTSYIRVEAFLLMLLTPHNGRSRIRCCDSSCSVIGKLCRWIWSFKAMVPDEKAAHPYFKHHYWTVTLVLPEGA